MSKLYIYTVATVRRGVEKVYEVESANEKRAAVDASYARGIEDRRPNMKGITVTSITRKS